MESFWHELSSSFALDHPFTVSSPDRERGRGRKRGENFLFFFFFLLLNLNVFILTGGSLLYNIVLVLPYISMNPPQVYTCSPSWTPLLPPALYHPSVSSQCTSPRHPVSCIEPGLVIHFLYDITRFNAIFPNHPTLSLSLRVQQTVLYICVSFAVSHTGLSLPSF